MELFWLIAVPLFIVFAYITLSNLWIILRFYICGKRGSTFPLLGGLIGFFGICLAPSDTIKSYWWVPFVLDPGSLLLLLHTIVSVITGKYKKLGSNEDQ
jgi:hypothetical protein